MKKYCILEALFFEKMRIFQTCNIFDQQCISWNTFILFMFSTWANYDWHSKYGAYLIYTYTHIVAILKNLSQPSYVWSTVKHISVKFHYRIENFRGQTSVLLIERLSSAELTNGLHPICSPLERMNKLYH